MKNQSAEYGILYIDDEEKSLKYFSAIFESIAPIYIASSPEEGYRIFVENHDRIALVLSDKKMPNESGIDLLQRIEAYDPRPFRFLVTAFADLNVAVDALNDGLLYSYLSKPWDPVELEHRLKKAMKHFSLMRERDKLVSEKTEAFQQLAMADKAAGIGVLSTGLNHHLRNSLTVLRTFYDMLPYQMEEEVGRPPKDTAFWTDYYNEVGLQMDRMTSMLSNLAEGVEAGSIENREEIDLEEVVRSSAHIVLEDRGDIEFRFTRNGEIPNVIGDFSKISQMVRLLFQEAKSALQRRGAIEAHLVQDEERDGLIITVLNDGNLIPENELPLLFDPFFVRSNSPEELGTNLLACYLTTYYHGGNIRAFHSNDGRNAVEIFLPRVPPAVSPEERAEDVRSIFETGGCIAKACETVLPA